MTQLPFSIAVAQLNPIAFDIEGNGKKALEAISKAKSVDLLVFSELFLTGYPPYDFLFEKDCMPRIQKMVQIIASSCQGVHVLLGTPWGRPDVQGRVYNAVLHLTDGIIKGVYRKQCLPFYDIFSEPRYFRPGKSSYIFVCKGARVGVAMCEDVWSFIDPWKSLYEANPLQELVGKMDVLVSPAASPWHMGKMKVRNDVIGQVVEALQVPLLYAHQVGAQDDLLFDGASVLACSDGSLVWQAPSWKAGVFFVKKSRISVKEDLIEGLVVGIYDYFAKVAVTDAVIGLSGGIDSSVTAALLVLALGKKHVHAFSLPSRFTSISNRADAERMAKILGISCTTVSIEPLFEETLHSLQLGCFRTKKNTVIENIQARLRSTLLMAQANKLKALLICTSNKSELSMGYGTLYGDLSGALAPLGDVWKHQVYELALHLSSKGIGIPQEICNKAPTAEMWFDQTDEEDLGYTYAKLDALLQESIVDKTVREPSLRTTIFSQEFKRNQAPIILRVSEKAFGSGRRFPSAYSRLSLR